MIQRKHKILITLLFISVSIFAQTKDNNLYPLEKDVSTLDGIINAYYEVISGAAGEERNWERDKSLHHPDALISVTGMDSHGKPYVTTQSISEYHKSFGIPDKGFWEYEISRETQRFGNIAHVWTTYKTTELKNGPVVERGINSIQLYNDGKRWWILSWMYDSERPDNLLPR